jgi:Uma2 family endonuclease
MTTTALSGPPGPVTAEQLQELPAADGTRYELVNGELHTMTPSGYRHGRVSGEVYYHLSRFVRDEHLGEVLAAETGFLLRRGPDTVRAPDVAFVSSERVPDDADEVGYVELAPDLVVEVVSPSDRAGAVAAKALAWLDAGVRTVWVVDPETALVAVHRPDGVVTLLRGDAVLDGGDVVPGFRLPLPELFRRA